MTRTLLLAAAAATTLSLSACNGEDDPDETDVEDTDNGDTDEVGPPLVTISGSSVDAFSPTGATGAEGLCVQAVDPSAALEGGDLNVLGETQLDANGAYEITDVDVSQAPLAVFLILSDCSETPTTILPSATGIASDEYASAVAGDTFTRDLRFVTLETAGQIDQSLAGVGSSATLAGGSIMAFVLDQQGNPVADATVDCGMCTANEYYYVDLDPEGGLLASATGPNTATQPGVGLALIVPGEVGGYSVSHPTLTIQGGLFGAIPGVAAFNAWTQ
jgi:hypothetical protein